MTPSIDLDVAQLEADLAAKLAGEVRFGDGDRALYATDASNYRQVPIGVVMPRTVDDVLTTIDICRMHGAPVLSRGGGTSLAGQCCNVAVVIDWSKYLHNVLFIDPEAKTARVQPGCVLDDLRKQASQYGLTFGPDPATHNHCTLGGMIGNNSCGVHSVMAGRTADNVVSLDVVTYDGLRLTVGPTSADELSSIMAHGGRRGEIYGALAQLRDTYGQEVRERFPRIPRRVSGYNLDELLPENGCNVARALVGTEGTCVTILEAELRLVDDPPAKSLLVLGYPDVFAAGDHIPEVMAAGPIGCEGIDRRLFDRTRDLGLHPAAIKLMPDGNGWLIVEFGGSTKDESDDKARALMGKLAADPMAPAMKLFDDPQDEHEIWEVRESGLGATAHESGGVDTWPGWEDSAVPPSAVGAYLHDLRGLYDKYGFDAALYGHFGQGCIHTRIDFDLLSNPGVDAFRDFVEEAADLVVSYGGSLSGEHGDGQARAELLPTMYGPRLVEAFREFKRIWDPDGRMNPGKVVDPNPLDGNLRLGTDFSPWEPVTFFGYREDEGSFARAAGLRCVGVGNCRREDGGTMCPSYMVTREEKDSTRGRARLLFEMVRGDVIADGWRSEAVRDALDLCLACKGCFGDCPVNVDMATYKAEFLSHHYARRLRPRTHYSMGWLPTAARVAAKAPRVVNATTHLPVLRDLTKRVAGIAPEREIPRFATRTFRQQARPGRTGGKRVVLWTDTFTNYFHPDIGIAALDVLEAAGFEVTLPSERLCCGLTWISTGQLTTAKKRLGATVAALAPYVRDGVPVIGLEPSCTAVFRHDLSDLFPHDRDAQRLTELTFTLAEVLERYAPDWAPPRMPSRAVVQGHCHHKAIMQMEADMRVLERTGVDAELLDSGCCGLAGNFGFEAGHYDVSLACAERVLVPAVNAAPSDCIVMADGFSCRTQIAHTTSRNALHLSQVLAMAIHQGQPGVVPPGHPENTALRDGDR